METRRPSPGHARPDRTPRARRSCIRRAVFAALAVGLAGCPEPPAANDLTFVLFVSDTTRVDAVSTYGEAEDTTPNFDRLAAEGVWFRRAYANAPWTLPSHTTMFTGRLPSEHAVGMTRTRASDSLDFLAERLKRAGFQTLGLSENPWISERFNTTQGFEHFRSTGKLNARTFSTELDALLKLRRTSGPAFIFVNVMDAHGPFGYRPKNPFLPPEVDRERATEAAATIRQHGMCSATDLKSEYQIVRKLYLDGVHRADAKLGIVLERLARGEPERVVTIATSDHGHHFGEKRLTGHEYSVREELLRVPLVVHGLPGISSTMVDTPVQLADLPASIMAWADTPGSLDERSRPIPLHNRSAPSRPVIAEYADTGEKLSGEKSGFLRFAGLVRKSCGPEHRVFGDMRALIRYPYKLISFERYPSELYNLDAGSNLRQDFASDKPQLVAELEGAMAQYVSEFQPPPQDTPIASQAVPDEVIERLRKLGYEVAK